MASTLTIQNAVNFATPILKNQPIAVSNWEPGLTAGNIVLQRMLGAPFRWRFNRSTYTFVTVVGQTDYPITLVNLGFIEDQWIVDSTGTIYPLAGAISLVPDQSQTRPTQIAPQNDNNAGQITFRIAQAPDAIYTVNGVYQKKAPLLGSYASPWAPVPDEFSYIFNLGFLCFTSLLVNDSRFPIFEKWFVGALLGAQDGLSEQEKNIFLGNWIADISTLTRGQGKVNQGVAGRGQ
jgi:hypothetical protein